MAYTCGTSIAVPITFSKWYLGDLTVFTKRRDRRFIKKSNVKSVHYICCIFYHFSFASYKKTTVI